LTGSHLKILGITLTNS